MVPTLATGVPVSPGALWRGDGHYGLGGNCGIDGHRGNHAKSGLAAPSVTNHRASARHDYPHPILQSWCAFDYNVARTVARNGGGEPPDRSPTVLACRPAYAAKLRAIGRPVMSRRMTICILCNIAHAHHLSTGFPSKQFWHHSRQKSLNLLGASAV
jgi:hypothetical protein